VDSKELAAKEKTLRRWWKAGGSRAQNSHSTACGTVGRDFGCRRSDFPIVARQKRL
jgi:hypothetical protein